MRSLVHDEDRSFMVVGGVPADWRHRRVAVAVELADALPFLDVEAPQTHEFLNGQMAHDLNQLGVDMLDVGILRGRDRLVSRAVATWAYAAIVDDGGPRYSGVRYLSRLGDWECWAVFDGVDIVEKSRRVIDANDPQLREISQTFDLRVF